MAKQIPSLNSLPIDVLEKVDRVCVEFENSRRIGESLPLERYLDRLDASVQPRLLHELLLIEFEYLRREGRKIPLVDYQQRFSRFSDSVKRAFEKSSHAVEATRIASQSVPAELAGRRIRYVGNYEIIDEIARGGMGVVYKARQSKLNRVVALKMILSGQFAGRDEVDRFIREAQAAGRLRHPHIVAIHEIGEYEGRPYFTMDFVEGQSLAERLREETLTPKETAILIRRIAKTVHFAHKNNTLHRDLKPGNILLNRQGVPLVTDFGLAKIQSDTDDQLTPTGLIVGTPSFMSPEQALGNHNLIGPATDIWALGAIIYTCLNGRPPFVADNPVETMRQVIHSEPVSPRLLNANIPKDLETICLKCLSKESHERYGTANLLAADLERFLEGKPVVARPIGFHVKLYRWTLRNPVVSMLVLLCALLLVTGASVSTYFAVNEHDARIEAVENAQQANNQKNIAIAERRRAELAEEQERQARLEADASAKGAIELKEAAETARQLERDARLKSDHDRLMLTYARGEQLCMSGNVRHGLLWLERALQGAIDQKSPELEDLIRHQLGAFTKRSCVPELELPDSWYNQVLFSPDDSMILSTSSSRNPKFNTGVIKLWDSKSGDLIGKVETKRLAMAWMTDTTRELKAVTHDAEIFTWDMTTLELRNEIKIQLEMPNNDLPAAIIPESDILIVEGRDHTSFYKLSTGLLIKRHEKYRQSFGVLNDAKTKYLRYINPHTYSDRNAKVAVFNVSDGSVLNTTFLVPYSIQGACFHPDGNRVLLAGHSKDPILSKQELRSPTDSSTPFPIKTEANYQVVAQLWDLSTSTSIGKTLPAGGIGDYPSHSISSFSPDGRQFAIAGPYNQVGVWNTDSQRKRFRDLHHETRLHTVSYSPDGQFLVVVTSGGKCHLWDAQTGQAVVEPFDLGGRGWIRFSQDGQRFAIAATQRGKTTARVWRLPEQTREYPPIESTRPVSGVATSPTDGKLAYTNGYLNIVEIPDDGQPQIVRTLRSQSVVVDYTTRKDIPVEHRKVIPAGSSSKVTWRSDGRYVATLEGSHEIALWDTRTWTDVNFTPKDCGANCGPPTLLNNSLTCILATPWDVRQFNFDDAEDTQGEVVIVSDLERFSGPQIDITNDGRFLMVGESDGEAYFVDLKHQKSIGETMRQDGRIQVVAISSAHQKSATATSTGELTFWNFPTGQQSGIPVHHEAAITALRFHPTQPILVSGSEDGELKFWHIRHQRQIGDTIRHNGKITSMCFNLDATQLIVGIEYRNNVPYKRGAVYWWNVPEPSNDPIEALRPKLEWMTWAELGIDDIVRDLPWKDVVSRREQYELLIAK